MAAHTHTPPGNFPHLFPGRGSRLYDVVARRVARGLYRRITEFTGQAVRHGRVRTGLPLFPRCYRHVLTKAG